MGSLVAAVSLSHATAGNKCVAHAGTNAQRGAVTGYTVHVLVNKVN